MSVFDASDAANPLALFQRWFAEATQSEPNDPNAMALATADSHGFPSVRMVLLKGSDARGFVFYTNLDSQKGRAIASNPRAALCFHWKSLRRQVRLEGPVARVSDEEADAYFATRPKDSQIGAWASKQSHVLEGQFALEREIARFAGRYALGTVPRPPHWSGFRLVPLRYEFWSDRPFRLHDRLVFRRAAPESDTWESERLYP